MNLTQKSFKKNILLDAPYYSVVLFYSNSCAYSKTAVEHLKTLHRHLYGVEIATCEYTPGTIELYKTLNITSVPLFVFYINGVEVSNTRHSGCFKSADGLVQYTLDVFTQNPATF